MSRERLSAAELRLLREVVNRTWFGVISKSTTRVARQLARLELIVLDEDRHTMRATNAGRDAAECDGEL